VPTNEELLIARDTAGIVSAHKAVVTTRGVRVVAAAPWPSSPGRRLVVWTCGTARRDALRPSPTPAASAPPTAARSENIVYRSFKGDKESFV
jgi:hypothetical protein